MPRYFAVGDYVGLEIETERILSGAVSRRINEHVWTLDHDASIESDVRSLPCGLLVDSIPSGSQFQFSNNTLGTEIVLNPPYCLESSNETLLEELKVLTETLMSMGESEENQRAGIHVHVSMTSTLRLLKTFVRVGAYLEDVFFHLGTQGYTFRGMLKNDSAYCRPITQYGPQCVPVSSTRWAQVFDTKSLLNCNTSKEFWWRYGNVNPNNDIGRYHPARYTWLNLYSLLAHGTLEFRLFNTTLNPLLIWSEILFCKAVAEQCLAMGMNKEIREDLPENSIYNGRSKGDILSTFAGFVDRLSLPSRCINILGDTLTRAPAVVLPKTYIKTHLRQGHGYDFSNYPIQYLTEDECETIAVDDIHARRGER